MSNHRHYQMLCVHKAYLHDDEEDECDEDVDLGMFPGVVVADVVELLGHALTAPRAVVEQRHQRLMLRQLTSRHKGKVIFKMSVYYIIIPDCMPS